MDTLRVWRRSTPLLKHSPINDNAETDSKANSRLLSAMSGTLSELKSKLDSIDEGLAKPLHDDIADLERLIFLDQLLVEETSPSAAIGNFFEIEFKKVRQEITRNIEDSRALGLPIYYVACRLKGMKDVWRLMHGSRYETFARHFLGQLQQSDMAEGYFLEDEICLFRIAANHTHEARDCLGRLCAVMSNIVLARKSNGSKVGRLIPQAALIDCQEMGDLSPEEAVQRILEQSLEV